MRPQNSILYCRQRVAGASKALNIATEALKGNALAQGDVINMQKELVNQQDQLTRQFGAAGAGVAIDGKGETQKAVKSVESVLKDLGKELIKLDSQFVVVGGHVGGFG